MMNVIFDLDGTLALIQRRRLLSSKPCGGIDWDVFFDPNNIALDIPNEPVIKMAQILRSQGYRIVIFSGRLDNSFDATTKWLKDNSVEYDAIYMRPNTQEHKYTPDDILKKNWLDSIFPDKSQILCVYDDRDKVVKMWRDNGITCFQVNYGNF